MPHRKVTTHFEVCPLPIYVEREARGEGRDGATAHPLALCFGKVLGGRGARLVGVIEREPRGWVYTCISVEIPLVHRMPLVDVGVSTVT